MRFRTDFKFFFLVFKAMNSLTPAYICDMWTPHEPDCCLRSSSRALLVTPKSQLVTEGDRAFSVPAPKLRYSVPADLRQVNSVTSFKSPLKTNCNHLASSQPLACAAVFIMFLSMFRIVFVCFTAYFYCYDSNCKVL